MPVEMRAFHQLAARYEQQHPRVAIEVEQVGYQTRDAVDTLIAAGVGPDIIRVQYLDMGRYSPSSALIDLSKYLPAHTAAEFTDQTWAAVTYKGRTHALPHHTDTSAILYNKTAFDRLGIKPPQSLEASWSWEEFIDVARALKKKFDYAFAVNWALGGSFRWLNFLYQSGGTLLRDDFCQSALPSPESLETLRWTQSFFREALVPISDSAHSSEQVENVFANGVVGMYFDVGPISIRELHTDFEWATTFLPRHRRMAAELGGNALGVSRTSRYPDLSVDFVRFATNEENMRDFCIAAQFLPVRKSLISQGIKYDYRPDEMRVHLEQSKTVPIDLARTVTLPSFHRINRVLGDELDLAFAGGQSAEETLAHVARAIARANTQS